MFLVLSYPVLVPYRIVTYNFCRLLQLISPSPSHLLDYCKSLLLDFLVLACCLRLLHCQPRTFPGFGDINFAEVGIPSREEYLKLYAAALGYGSLPRMDFYTSYVCFRFGSIAQGIYKRYTQGRA